ncbi:2-keto-4-pentenoate hydratase [Psychrobacter sp. I-STPA10]|uniref:2-keto-4-pentenoate hydratase n=1 Tax=Psychrobacter sp. I-STPA10 TaxID=2585769 RepID=UPI001E524A50|nr:hypothetical protein [Psychrobacter sp. I-STPA10]
MSHILSNTQLSEHLYRAYVERIPLAQSVMIADLSSKQAYDIQHAVTDKKIANGAKLAGYKISMTSKRTMALFNSAEPMYGQLIDKQVWDNSQPLSLSTDVNSALVELELAFIAQEKLLASDTPEQICKKCLIAPCLEIPDSRYQDWFPKMSKEHLCVDSAVAGYVCIGQPVTASYDELSHEVGRLYINDELVLTEPASVVLEHPALAVQWLVQKLQQHNLSIEAGMFVSSGSFGMPVTLEMGTYKGEFQSVGEVSLTVQT